MLEFQYKLPESIVRKYKKVKVFLPPDAERIFLDSQKWYFVSRALRHLFQNAIQYGRPNDSGITVRMAPDSGGALTIEVEDKGIGIPENELEAIMDLSRDHRAANAIAHKATGEGKGFNDAHEIARHLGGNISIESKLNEGTTVRLFLPGVILATESYEH